MTAGVWTGTVSPLRGPAAGLLAQFAVLGGLTAAVGLGAGGWVTGTVYALALCALLARAMHRSGLRVFGPANAVTLSRATLVGGVTALVTEARTPVAVLVVLASVALVLDGVDGVVARRTGSTSPFGARFDGEVDAFLILVLSVYVSYHLGWWVLAIGAFRYAFVAAGWHFTWLRGDLPVRYSRKTVAAVQGVVLVTAASGLLPGLVAGVLVAAALAALIWSFGRDIAYLHRTYA
ncbi:CDP-alcohol phosphatidyltransferase family protein [Catenuloplanes atrovinosus]|uniref:Phosphatidylglycerophosphate synthase n=1 Tax=Catenuloplanes atrovinosus TaxID=137266 RepID=A0AAE3YMS5_9ACTN|nr:CDP-alcohol phosphatidyltransferase family protein [Catenuloplanes atrovinosus]MDR7276649.1 phosphatidylglycerophosphate synthase [Catenuloplanes atrovinosus]